MEGFLKSVICSFSLKYISLSKQLLLSLWKFYFDQFFEDFFIEERLPSLAMGKLGRE